MNHSLRQLHILNGSAMLERFKGLRFKGFVIPWNEAFIEGPLLQDITSENFWTHREKYWRQHTEKLPERMLPDLLPDLLDFDEVILWFEYDLFCQINLLGAINYLIQKAYRGTIYLVQIGPKEVDTFSTFGHANDSQWKQCYQQKQLISTEHFEWIELLWSYLTAVELDTFNKIFRANIPTPLHYMKDALTLIKKLFSNSQDNLNEVERSFVKLKSLYTENSLEQVIGALLKDLHLFGFGDSQVLQMLSRPGFISNYQFPISIKEQPAEKYKSKSFSNYRFNDYFFDEKKQIVLAK